MQADSLLSISKLLNKNALDGSGHTSHQCSIQLLKQLNQTKKQQQFQKSLYQAESQFDQLMSKISNVIERQEITLKIIQKLKQ